VTPLPKRARAVLYAVVTEFIATAEPVGSRTLSKKYGFSLSAATIRNVLADLEDAGYLEQPHTSAGRVPTEAAFRFFVDRLMQVRELPRGDAERITEYFDEIGPGVDILRETGKLLSDLSGAPAVLVRARGEHRTLLKVRFIPTRPSELLSVIVFSDGTVENRFVHLEKQISESELERVHNMLELVVNGRTLADVRDFLVAGSQADEDELAALRHLGYSLIRAASETASRSVDVIIQGQSRLLDRPEFGSVERIRDLLHALEDRERLLSLLDRTLAAGNVKVFLGQETSEMVGCPVSLVAAPYGQEGEPAGAVGIIGPTRMDYPFVVPLVGATAEAMSAAIVRLRDAKDKGKPES
jgi:heat-inducible transcriptional repressor